MGGGGFVVWADTAAIESAREAQDVAGAANCHKNRATAVICSGSGNAAASQGSRQRRSPQRPESSRALRYFLLLRLRFHFLHDRRQAGTFPHIGKAHV